MEIAHNVSTDGRKLVTVETIADLSPIPGADNIEAARIRGWSVVVKKGEFKTGDLCVFFEIDSFLPTDDARFAFLEKNAITYNGVRGTRLRTIKLKGQISQGLALPINLFSEIPPADREPGTDVTAILGIEKWDRPISATLSATVRGNFPSFIPKTNQERVQNYWFDKHLSPLNRMNDIFEISLKLDGTSMTVYLTKDGDFGVCSRNYDLLDIAGNAYWDYVREHSIEEKMRDYAATFPGDLPFPGIAIQGELMGPGIQGNPERLKNREFFVFDVVNLTTGRKYTPTTRKIIANKLEIRTVPIAPQVLKLNVTSTLEEVLSLADGPSLSKGVLREGIVVRSFTDPHYSFKVISNKWLEANLM